MIVHMCSQLSSGNFPVRRSKAFTSIHSKQVDRIMSEGSLWFSYCQPLNPCSGELRTASLVSVLCNTMWYVKRGISQLWCFFFFPARVSVFQPELWNIENTALRTVLWFLIAYCSQPVSFTGIKGMRPYCSGGNPPRSKYRKEEGGSVSQWIPNPRAAEIIKSLEPKHLLWVTIVNWTAGGSMVWENKFYTASIQQYWTESGPVLLHQVLCVYIMASSLAILYLWDLWVCEWVDLCLKLFFFSVCVCFCTVPLFSFCLFVLFYFITFYYYVLEACLFSNGRQKGNRSEMGRNVGRDWRSEGKGNCN